MPFGGQVTAHTSSPANVAHAEVIFDTPLQDANYRAFATLVTTSSITDFDHNYDVNVSITKKTINGFTIDIHRGTEGFLDASGAWMLDYIVLP